MKKPKIIIFENSVESESFNNFLLNSSNFEVAVKIAGFMPALTRANFPNEFYNAIIYNLTNPFINGEPHERRSISEWLKERNKFCPVIIRSGYGKEKLREVWYLVEGIHYSEVIHIAKLYDFSEEEEIIFQEIKKHEQIKQICKAFGHKGSLRHFSDLEEDEALIFAEVMFPGYLWQVQRNDKNAIEIYSMGYSNSKKKLCSSKKNPLFDGPAIKVSKCSNTYELKGVPSGCEIGLVLALQYLFSIGIPTQVLTEDKLKEIISK